VEVTIPSRPFESFQKISRANKSFGCVITEKLDGTNAQIVIEDGVIIGVGSRSRWIKPGKDTDNFGFAGWVQANAEPLLGLGDGAHFGEWFGTGIQRTYGLTERRFALFNTGRWSDAAVRPACCDVVPVLYAGEFSRETVRDQMHSLKDFGSVMVPGFSDPEGIVIYLPGSRVLLKETFEYNEGKWAAANDVAPVGVAA